MYINKIDELVNNIIDDFYNTIITKKDFKKFLTEVNFVKYQLEINKIFTTYFTNINKKEINAILNDDDNTAKLIEIIKKYIAYYMFMIFGFFYNGKQETYINNIVEFTKNQPSFNFKINNFFNSDSNSIVIKFHIIIKNILILLDADSVKQSQLSKKQEFSDTISFLNELGKEVVDASFKLKNLNGNVFDQAHNIIKMILINELYLKQDKKEINEFLDQSNAQTGEFIYIDIIVPRTESIDYNTIENSLTQREVELGMASEIYELLAKVENEKIIDKHHDEKILDLLNSRIIIPITEDFMLYHKDSEKYEKPLNVTNQTLQTKKKDETKIKYIINKIDSVSEYYSKNTKSNNDLKKNIEKLFYQPLADRKAILVNNIEDIKIINKLQNQGRRAIENNEYYNDLLSYRQYPYINFKDIQNYGFNLNINQTLDAVRSINFEKINEMNRNKFVQMRITSPHHSVNIIGFIIKPQYTDIKCLKLKDFVDIRKVGYNEGGKVIKNDNGFNITLKLLKKHITTSNNKKRPAVYWLFDLEKDKVKLEKYDVISKMNNNEHIKIMIGTLYDNLLTIVNDEIIQSCSKNEMTLQKFYKLLNKINSKIIEVPTDIKSFNDLEKIIYNEKIVRLEDKYDGKEDEFPGLLGDIIELPAAPEKQKEKMPIMKLEKFKKQKISDADELMEAEKYGAICQHNISWDNISALRKKNPNKFSELLFEFFQQYVIKNHEDDFICKSCGSQINLRNYVLDGTYDDDGRFVSFNMPMEVPIEDIPEYEKYKSTIRNLEKIIERIASISNINSLTGTSLTIKMRIRKIVRDALDLILVHNANLKSVYKERSEKISLYGLNKELSNLFIFDLDNSIFVYSSKDKDFYKPIKRNNITMYLLLLMILELNDSQIYYMTGDKICNYYLFSKYGMNWFNGIHIRKNNQNTITPILNYKVLCYIIFYMSCLITKYNLWYTENVEQEKTKKFDPMTQKVIIHTLVDFINSVLEFYGKKKRHFIYDILANKFFQKLNTTFKNEEILDRIKTIENKKIVTDDKKTKMVSVKIKPIELSHEYNYGTYFDTSSWMTCKIAKNFIKKRIDTREELLEISNITNCESGTFHKWIPKGTEYSCSICGISAKDTKVSADLNNKIEESFKETQLHKLAKKYCKSGDLHSYNVETDNKCSICTKCNKIETDKLSRKELDELEKNISKMKDHTSTKEEKPHKKDKSDKYRDFINEMKSSYGKSKQHKEDYQRFIDAFISKVEALLGKDINLRNKDIYLRYDSYIIDHDHNGNAIEKPFTINDVSNKILFRKDHQFFKKDVIYYTNNKLQIDIFYDASTKLLLGYKEKNKEFQYSRRHNIYLKVNNSIMSRIKMLGYPTKFIKIKDRMNELKLTYKDPNTRLRQIISELNRNRIQKLKRFISDFQRYIYRIAYNYQRKPIDEENNPDKFIDTYKNKLNNVVLNDKKNKVFKNWKGIKYELFFENLENKTINIDPDANYISVDDLSMYDYSGNIILFYLINEMNKLLDLNNDKFTKTTLTYLLLDIIVRVHDEFDEDKDMTNTEIKRFKYTLEIQNEKDIEDVGGATEGFYDEYKDPDEEVNEDELEQKEEDKELMDALDIEDGEEGLEYDNVDYESGVNFDG
ncbi:hypothetical protein QKU48_gp0526 [Fadolivirus algeromassiliense]|jgi:uncharacterized protein YggL (DUF469 family)|uniref:Uncharacterized protein n=1 Tax=Fadolivirus FV1/VV64 TaxID=3070911 RepID=A0A7D3QV46_9VIRU|nr:hypothetical protein QKU48_gp0526 [Fadolivirus algeromassiliense]QKF93984.1 hypothetical protein Fadolivirus_1_526 [Fadolivirus FV1/VV64]